MSVLIIKHVEIEGPGLIEDCLKEERIPYQILNLEPWIQFHLEVTKEMIHEWMKTYEDEFSGSQPPLVPKLKILCETEKKIELHKRRGAKFFKKFLTKIADLKSQLQPAG